MLALYKKMCIIEPMEREQPIGFFEVTGFTPFEYGGLLHEKVTFGLRRSAEKFVAERGGKIQFREADGILVDGEMLPVHP